MTEQVAVGGQAQAHSVNISGNTIVDSGTSAAAPAQAQASGGQAQTTGNGSGAVAEETFFDPRSIEGKPELMSAYKQMQGEFTKRMQGFRSKQNDLQLVEQFRANPMAVLQQLAPQYGMRLIQSGQDEPSNKDWNPQSWDDVKTHFFEEFKKEQLAPLVSEVRDLKKQNIEQYLTTNHPDWRTYEDSMMDTLRKHPTLVSDPDTLYRMSVPANVIESRATAAALAKLKGATENAQVSGGTNKQATSFEPTGKLSFNEAVEVAKKRLAMKGLSPPAN